LAFSYQVSRAAEGDDSEAATVQRYTGPPIVLPEPEPAPPASMVEKQVNKDEFSKGKLHVEREIARYSDDRFVADGFYREFYPGGEKFIEGQYKNGHPEGTWTYYHENGQVQRTVNYKKGQPDGSWEVHDAEGNVIAKRGFKDGKREGTWVIYDETGKQPLREEVYAGGKADGVWKAWFPTGQLRTEATMKAGTRDGAFKEWDEKGNQRAELNFADGKLDGTATLWGAEGQKVVQQYEAGKLVKEERAK
jgi:antitoxin component YwqK of YwqJK toxin-antitoxin module